MNTIQAETGPVENPNLDYEFKMEDYVSDWKVGLIPALMETFEGFTNREKRLVLKELGLPYRVKNRRFNAREMLEIYLAHLNSL